jgi:small subunit ribosomal protein S4
MKKIRKKYERPKKLFDKQRIGRDKELFKTYGLKAKKEIWRTETILRKYRRLARELTGKENKEKEKLIIGKLIKFGMLNDAATLDDILGLTIENILERRLQTIVFRKGLANTANHARQLIVHGHVVLDGRRMPYPGYLVSREEENSIQITK